MTTHRFELLTTFAVTVVVLGGSLALGAGIAGAGHGAEESDSTIEPMDDRRPGATNVKYGMRVIGKGETNFRTVEAMTAVFKEGSWANCGPSDGDVFGIDRGNTHEGYEVDENLEDNIKSFSADDDVFNVEFYGENDFGSTTNLNSGDELVSVATCMDNPPEPGWYQIFGNITGIAESGERMTFGGESHYFWICDCEDERQARTELGPPPSEEATTESPVETPADNDASGDDPDSNGEQNAGTTSTVEGSSEQGSSIATESDDTVTPEPTETLEPARAAVEDSTQQSTAATDQASSWDSYVVETPTTSDGDGFGSPVALIALIAIVLLVYRRP